MISFAPFRPAPEVRESEDSYTDQQVAAAVATAKGTAASALTATVESIARLWEAGFTAGKSETLAPWQLALCGRALALKGEVLFWRASGLLPVADHDVQGDSAFPGRWRYRLTMPAPSTSITRNASADTVLHARVGATPRQPWRGCSPLTNAGATRAVLEQVERSLSEEHGGPVGNVVAVPDPGNSQDVVNEIAVLKGRTILGEASEMDVPGEGAGSRTNWKPNRIGPMPADGTIASREAVERSLLAAGGVPVELVQPHSGSDAREGWRWFLWSTIAPAAALVSAELRRIGLPDGIDFAALNASDLAGRARAYSQLRKAEMPEADARRLTGLE